MKTTTVLAALFAFTLAIGNANAAETIDPAEVATGAAAEMDTPMDLDSTGDLARAAQNPIADLISLPFQNNFNFGAGPEDGTQWILNIQPVAPLKINDDWNVITRTIMPVITQSELFAGTGDKFGLGDIQFTPFLAPSSGKVTWGIGPVLQFPTATDDLLGLGKWNIGPSAVVVATPGNWVIGGLVQNVWSVGGDSARADVNSFLFQYFINYNFDGGWYLTSAPINTINWNADSGEKWTVPLGGGFGRVFNIGKQPVNTQLAAFYNVVSPDTAGADWQLRFQLQFLFPK